MNGLTVVLCIIGSAVILALLFFVVPAFFEKPKSGGDGMGIPKRYKSDREHFNDNQRSLAFWSGSETYIDYDGRIINMNTHTIEGYTKPPSNR